ncbi:MAG: hypothetical protein Q9217_003403 [Psora testacea]
MPIASDASTVTSVTASPLEPHDVDSVPIELKLSLPSSKSSSDQDLPAAKIKTPDSENSTDQGAPKDTRLPDSISDGSCNDMEVETQAVEELGAADISLAELARLAQQDDYESRHTASLETDLGRLSLLTGSNRRLRDSLSIAYGNMIDQYKGDDQAGFTGLYEACERLTAQSSMPDESMPAMNDRIAAEKAQDSQSTEGQSLIHMLGPDDQDSITAFLNKIRTDLDYLANLISSLPPRELTALTSSYHPAGVDLSVLPNHSHGRTHAYSRDSQMMKLSRRMDSIDRFHNQDPYFALLYGVFDTSSALASMEHRRKADVWARTCAKVMTEGKLGSEEFTIATIDAFNGSYEWTLKPEMELYLLQMLAEGSFLLHPPAEPSPEKLNSMPPDGASHAIAVADFFDLQTRRLFTMLASGLPSAAVPQGVLHFIHAILCQIHDIRVRELAKKFIVSRWYFASFLSSILVYPEVQGMLLNHHIGQSARQLILKELVLRMQSQMFAVLSPSNSHMFVMPEMQDQIFHIIEFFQPPLLAMNPPPFPNTDDSVAVSTQLMLSHWDIIGLIEALHPDTTSTEPQPSPAVLNYPPSTASSATLRPGRNDTGSSESPSAYPSYANSSSTGDTLCGDGDTANGHSTQVVSTKSVQSGDGHHNSTPKAGPSSASQSWHLKSICNKLRNLAKSQGDANHLSSGWTLFEISAHDLRLRLSHGLLSSHSSSVPHPDMNQGPQETESRSVKNEIFKKALLSLLEPSGKFFPNHRDNVIAPVVGTKDHLQNLMENALATARSLYDFNAAHQWWRALTIYNDMKCSESSRSILPDLIRTMTTEFRARLVVLEERRRKCELMMRPLERQRRNQKAALEQLAQLRKALRIKMWYVSDIKNSSPYEDALLVTKALRAMAKFKREKQPGSIAKWARQRFRGSTPYDKADRQVLEALCATKDHGGPSKLADEQVELTSRWLTKNSIENFCKGEERIHRFCYEVHKSVAKLAGMNLLESPVLWSSHLFRREKACFDTRSRPVGISANPYERMTAPLRSNEPGALWNPTIGQSSAAYSGLPNARTKGSLNFTEGLRVTTMPQQFGHPPSNYGPRHPYPGLSSSQAFGLLSPPMTPLSPKLSEVFSASVPNRPEPESKPKKDFVEELKQRLTALIISDLGYLLWTSGSETDVWVTRATVQAQADHAPQTAEDTVEVSADTASVPKSSATISALKDACPDNNAPKHSSTDETSAPSAVKDNGPSDTFPYSDAYSNLLQKMSLTPDPYAKLQILCQLEGLVCSSLREDRLWLSINGLASGAKPQPESKPGLTLNKTIPRTKTTSLEEVIANCTERRAGTLRRTQPRNALPLDLFAPESTEQTVAGADEVADKLLSIFRDPKLRPSTLYRDLQFIAAFIPSSILDQTAQGKAFWNVGLAALAFKEDLINATIHRADEIMNYHLTTNQPRHFPGVIKVPPYLADTTLQDAAQLWLTAAKEGSPLAARELALFYLTHPDLLRRTTMPFSKSKEVFASAPPVDKSSVGALDPLTFSVVLHWMDIASSAGDNEAKEFLNANGALVRAS